MKKKVLIGILIIATIGSLVTVGIIKNNKSDFTFNRGRVYDVSAKRIGKGEISAYVEANGIIEEIDKSDVYFDNSLRIKKVLVKLDQKVKMGEKLVEIDMDSINSELRQRLIDKRVQELSIKKTKVLDSFQNTASLESAIIVSLNNIKSAERAYNDSLEKLKRIKVLYEAGSVSKLEFESAEKEAQDLKLALENAKANYGAELTNLEQIKELNSQNELKMDLELKTQRENLEAINLKISELENKIKSIQDNALSPIEGTVISVNVKEGEYLTNVQPAFTIINTDKLQVKASLSEYNIKNVKVGQKVKIEGDAIGDDDIINGIVEKISPVAIKSRTAVGDETVIEVTISISDSNKKLKPGLNVSCDIYTNEKKDILIAGLEMLKEDKDGNKVVFLIDEEKGIMKEIKVELGITSDMKVEIISGLSEGNLVIVDPQPIYKDGARVRIKNDEK